MHCVGCRYQQVRSTGHRQTDRPAHMHMHMHMHMHARTTHAPKFTFSPVLGLRVNMTPVPLSSPMLPKTIDCTVTPVPSESGMSLYCLCLSWVQCKVCTCVSHGRSVG